MNVQEAGKTEVKKLKNVKMKLDVVDEKFQQILIYQMTLRYMIDRDLKSMLK